MSAKLDLPDDFGWVEVTVGNITQRLDLYAVRNRIVELTMQLSAKPSELNQAIVDHIQSLGFPQVSFYVAEKFVLGIKDLLDELKKKEESSSANAG